MKKEIAHLLPLIIPSVLYTQTAEAKKGKTETPNLIVIMCDDLGYQDVGFNGCKDIPTPNIDRIAQEGVRFSNGYTPYSVSSPSRAGFMTGRYGQRYGYERNVQYRPNDPNMGLSKEEMTLPQSLKQVGYVSGIIGKWHLGAHPSNHPCNRGFDEFFGHLGGGHSYFPDQLSFDSYQIFTESQSYRSLIMRNHEHVKTQKYLTDEFSDEAVSFVTRHQEQPFFLYLAYNAPHTPLEATDEYLARFDHIKAKKRKTYAAMVSAVDDGVGRLLDRLKELKMDQNTIIFFLSDNGGPEESNGSNNGVLRGGKSSTYEGGYRVPFAMRWSNRLSPMVYDNPISSMDIFATMAALTGSPTLKERPLDGVNLLPYLTKKGKSAPHPTIYMRKYDQGRYAVRHNNHKLLVFAKENNRMELYNLKDDIGETKNIAAEFPEIVKSLDRLRLEWDQQLLPPAFEGLNMRDEENHSKK